MISGIAFGAINANIMGQFPKGKEMEGVEKMVEFWTKIGENYG